MRQAQFCITTLVLLCSSLSNVSNKDKFSFIVLNIYSHGLNSLQNMLAGLFEGSLCVRPAVAIDLHRKLDLCDYAF